MEYTDIESLLPLKDEIDYKTEPPTSEDYKKLSHKKRDLTKGIMNKNK